MKYLEIAKTIISENPINDIWKHLRYFFDNDSVISMIAKFHGLKGEEYKKQKSNIKKQSQQIAYCIRQAEEYFTAAHTVSIATKPVLLYYGAVSLSKALVLFKKDGDYSFDALREKEKHNHHGLELLKTFHTLKSGSTNIKSFFQSL